VDGTLTGAVVNPTLWTLAHSSNGVCLCRKGEKPSTNDIYTDSRQQCQSSNHHLRSKKFLHQWSLFVAKARHAASATSPLQQRSLFVQKARHAATAPVVPSPRRRSPVTDSAPCFLDSVSCVVLVQFRDHSIHVCKLLELKNINANL